MKRNSPFKSDSGVSPKKKRKVELCAEKENISLSRTVKIRNQDFEIYCNPEYEKAIDFLSPVRANECVSDDVLKAINDHRLFNSVFQDKQQRSAVQLLRELSTTFPYSKWDLIPAEAREHALKDIIALANVTTLAVLMVLHKGSDDSVLDLVAFKECKSIWKRLIRIRRSAESCMTLSESKKYLGAHFLDSENSTIKCKHRDQILQFPIESIQGDLILRLGVYGARLVSRSLWYETSPLACLSNVTLDSCLSPKTLIAELTALVTSGWKGLVQEDVTTVPVQEGGEYARVPNDSIWSIYRQSIEIYDM